MLWARDVDDLPGSLSLAEFDFERASKYNIVSDAVVTRIVESQFFSS